MEASKFSWILAMGLALGTFVVFKCLLVAAQAGI
jgi:hypothetical protein